MFYHQKVARVRVFADIQNFALRAHCVHGIPMHVLVCMCSDGRQFQLNQPGPHNCYTTISAWWDLRCLV